MFTLTGMLLNIVDKSKYKKDNIEVDTKAKVQILVVHITEYLNSVSRNT